MAGKLWGEKEITFLTENFSTLGAHICSENLGRSLKSVQVKASRLKLKTAQEKLWTQEDINILIQEVPKCISYKELSARLNRSEIAIEQKARSLGLASNRFFSSYEDSVIIEEYPEGDVFDIAEKLNRSHDAIVKRAFRLKIKRKTKHPTAYLYIVKFIEYPELNLFKVGLTNNPDRRFREFQTKVEVCSLLHGSYEDICNLEQYLLNFIKPYKKNYDILRSGNTETYSC
jgi:hypothetical protein